MKNSLLSRNIGLLVGVVLTGQILAGLMIVMLVLQPQSVRVADMSARMLNALSVMLEDKPAGEQESIVQIIRDEGNIRLRASDDPPDSMGRAVPSIMERLFMRSLASKLRGQDELAWRTDRSGHLWMLLHLGGRPYWVSITPPRFGGPLTSMVFALIIAFLVAAMGGLLLQRRLNRPLKSLVDAAKAFDPGQRAKPIVIDGPREIAAVAHAMNDMSHRIAAHEEERALMLAGVSHDLRTPLARLRLAIEMMGRDDEDLHQSAVRQVERIDHMLTQFLDYAREARSESEGSIKLAEVLENAIEDAGLTGQVALDLEQGLSAWSRPHALCRAVKNLLENAARYGEPPIALTGFRTEAGIAIEVTDHGKGFGPDEIERLLQPFAKSDEARSSEGTGLGLAIVARQVASLNASMAFERGDGTFTARIILRPKGAG